MLKTMNPLPLLCACIMALPCLAAELRPGAPVEIQPFNPDKWKEHQVSTRMVPWLGQRVVFLTASSNHSPRVMTALVESLDKGWEVYADLTGRQPGRHKQVLDKPSFVALPRPDLSCGIGCGFLGVSGVELGKFDQDDYPRLQRNIRDVPHYMFYEMGRNFYTFGKKHSEFTTGFAVFMRYVVIDALGLDDAELETRRRIEEVEARLGATDHTFARLFTNHSGLGEKAPRLADVHPCDQPVTYASAMLRLRREHGGDAWVRRFFQLLATAPDVEVRDEAGALVQARHWFLCACLAAQADLSPDFCDRWRMTLPPTTRQALATFPWGPGATLDSLNKHLPVDP